VSLEIVVVDLTDPIARQRRDLNRDAVRLLVASGR
jgi:hypothetical protein